MRTQVEGDERQRLIEEFIDVFPVTEELATNVLTMNDWNLDASVRNFINMCEEGSVPEFNRNETDENNDATVAPESSPVLVQNVIFRFLWNLLSAPYHLVLVTVRDVFRTLFSVFSQPFRSSPTPLADVESFIGNFENSYGPQHPVFYRGPYGSALADAKKELRYLIVYLHCSYHQDTDKFCRDVVCHPDFVSFVDRVGLFWACDVSSTEGYRVSNIMMDTTYPFLAVVCLRNRRMSIVHRQEGYVTVAQLISQLDRVVSINDYYINLARDERRNTERNQSLRKEQEAAYQEALQKDKESEMRVLDSVKKQMEEEARLRAAIDKKEQDEQALVDRKERCASSLPAEPTSKDAVRLKLQFPSGDTFQRHFLPSDSIMVAVAEHPLPTIGSFCSGRAEAVLVIDNDA